MYINKVVFDDNESYDQFYRRLFQNYNPEHDPGHRGKNHCKTFVNVSLVIASFSRVSVEKMEFVVGMYFAMQWLDPRLEFEGYPKVRFWGCVFGSRQPVACMKGWRKYVTIVNINSDINLANRHRCTQDKQGRFLYWILYHTLTLFTILLNLPSSVIYGQLFLCLWRPSHRFLRARKNFFNISFVDRSSSHNFYTLAKISWSHTFGICLFVRRV